MALIDRHAELDTIGALFEDVRQGSSGVLVVRGQAGIGKTALLETAAERAAAAGMQVVRATGVQSEMEYSFGGLHQLMLPFLAGLANLPVRQRAALESTFGLADGQLSDRYLTPPPQDLRL